jgi:iron complex transport system permease protein
MIAELGVGGPLRLQKTGAFPAKINRHRWKLIFPGLIAVLFIAFIGAVGIGPVRVSPADVAHVITGRAAGGETAHSIVFLIRMPRVVLSALVGACLSISGVVLQGLLKNPMADPYVLGISSGAAFGAVLAILFGLGSQAFGFNAVPAAAFAGGMATIFLVYNLARVRGRLSITSLLLAGIAIGSLLSAMTSLAMVISGQELHRVIFWLMGGLVGTTWTDVQNVVPYMAAGVLPIYWLARDLNLLLLGEEPAIHLGSDVEKVKLILLASSSLVAAAAVSVSGIIGFVGLIIPHSVRFLVGPDHRTLLPAAALVGAIFMVLADTIARTVGGAVEIPVGVITALCGAPFFIYLLRRKKEAVF